MPDDWSWFWAGEGGRDRLLREELEGLQATASASSAQSARLSSQLRTLQGSMESRLQALSTAFDAYVELGDVREQLAGYPDTSAARREVRRALDVLAQGGVPGPVDAPEVDYWLVDAANEVLALVAGHTSRAETPAGSGSAGPEHEMFVVAALGWLGCGELVATRVAPLLVADGALAAPQVVLWRAVVHGSFGHAADAVVGTWTRELDLSPSVWETFARTAAEGEGPVETLQLVRDLVEDRPLPAPEPAPERAASVPDDRAALRSLLDALVGAGLGEERALLERSRVLRARIEDPGTPEADPRAEPPRTPTTELVQQALLDPYADPEVRRTLVAHVRPGLEAAASAIALRVAVERPRPITARTPLGDVDVAPDGADPARLAQLDALAVEQRSTPRARLLVPGVVAAVALVAGLVLLTTEVGGLGVFLLLAAVTAAGLLVRELLRGRERVADLADVRQRTRESVEAARARAVAVRAETLETQTQVAGLARSITGTGVAVGDGPR